MYFQTIDETLEADALVKTLKTKRTRKKKEVSARVIWKVRSMVSYLNNGLIKCYQIIHFWKLEFNGYLMV